MQRKKLKKVSTELSDSLKRYGNIYIEFFSVYFHIYSYLIDSRIVEDSNMEFIVKFDTMEQAKYIIRHENELNQNFPSSHKMTLLGDNCISLVAIRK